MTIMVPLLFLLQYILGSSVVQGAAPLIPFSLFRKITAFMVGVSLSIPLLYLGDVIFKNYSFHTYGAMFFLSAATYVLYRIGQLSEVEVSRPRHSQDSFVDYGVLFFALTFSSYIMMKTFRVGIDGALFVGSNEVFDFGHNLSIIRSFSWGNNVPYLSPFVAGAVDIYHFFFYYWVGFLERLGVPLVYAFNIPSIISFTFLLVTVYYFQLYVVGSRRIVGILTVLFTITHSTLTWWFFIVKNGISVALLNTIWRLPAYPFAAPYDKSAISIYQTLNVFVNQRHLALPLAMSLLLYAFCVTGLRTKTRVRQTAVWIGIMLGIMPLWHLVLTLAIVAVVGFTYVHYRRWKELIIVTVLTSVGVVLAGLPWLFSLTYTSVSGDVAQIHAVQFVSKYSFLYSFFVNYGIAVLAVPLGFLVLPKDKKSIFLPFLVLLFGSYLLSALIASEVDQKFLNMFLLLFSMLSAYGTVWLLKKGAIGKTIAAVFVFAYMASGIIDLMVIKNDFMYRIPHTGRSEFVSWIHEHTSPDAVFLSYADIFDPVTLAGRKNYFGFFRNFGQPDRTNQLPELYGSRGWIDSEELTRQNIHYVVFPTQLKDGFLFSSYQPLYEEKFPLLYQDSEVTVFDVRPKT